MRSGNPLTAFVQTNRSRSLWAPSLGPGTGPDRPSYAPGRGPEDAVTGDPNRWFDPTAFVLPPIGTLGNVGRNDLIGPDLRTTDLSFTKSVPWARLGPGGQRPAARRRSSTSSIASTSGRRRSSPSAAPASKRRRCASFGQIRSTITSARQMQLGVRVTF